MKPQEFVETVKEATKNVIKDDPHTWEYLVPNVWDYLGSIENEPEKDILYFFNKSDDGAPMGFLEEYLFDYKNTLTTDNGDVKLEKISQNGSEITRVFSITPLKEEKQYFSIKGYYSSWEEEVDYLGYSFMEVEPREKTIIEYVPR